MIKVLVEEDTATPGFQGMTHKLHMPPPPANLRPKQMTAQANISININLKSILTSPKTS